VRSGKWSGARAEKLVSRSGADVRIKRGAGGSGAGDRGTGTER
jgi:hypothetical protein